MRPLLRLAWRDARRARGRSVLIAGMVGLPVAAVTAGLGLASAQELDLPGAAQVPLDPATAAVYALVLAAVGLQVVLMAGAAFAVGVRRQRRTLGLLAAVGAEPAQLRRTVLAGGLVLGPLGAAAGLLVGWLGGRAAKAVWPGTFPAPYTVPGWVLWVAAGGVASAVLATLAPGAQAARLPVVAALAGREGQVRVPRGWPVLGALLTAAGLVVSVVGVRAHEFGVVLGAVCTILGLVLATPAIVVLAGRLGRRLPVPARFAVRDAARHRGRTAPAVAAILAAVAGLTALAVAGSSDNAQERQDNQNALPLGRTAVMYYGEHPDRMPAIRAAIVAAAPRADPVAVGELDNRERESAQVDQGDCRCNLYGYLGYGVVVADPSVLPLVTDHPTEPAVLDTLNAGGAVVFDPAALSGGRLAVTVGSKRYTLPAAATRPVDPLQFAPATAMVTPATAAKLGLYVRPTGWVLGARDLPADQLAAVDRAVRHLDGAAGVYTEVGYATSFTAPALVLGGIALLLVLGATLIATGLAAADARPDLATMAAVGAAPGLRRLVAASQAGVVALLGTLVGTAAGLVPGIAITWPLTANGNGYTQMFGIPEHGPVLDVPWLLLAAIAVGVPLLAMLVSAATTPGRLPTTRRLAT